MQELEKIPEKINELHGRVGSECTLEDHYTKAAWKYCLDQVTEIIRKHMENDEWIPVEKELPPLERKLQATILHHEWISDYNSSWVPEEEKSYHPEYTEVCEIYPVKGEWYYACSEEEYERDIAYITPEKNLGNPISEIIAWRPMPEPYRPERRRKA